MRRAAQRCEDDGAGSLFSTGSSRFAGQRASPSAIAYVLQAPQVAETERQAVLVQAIALQFTVFFLSHA